MGLKIAGLTRSKKWNSPIWKIYFFSFLLTLTTINYIKNWCNFDAIIFNTKLRKTSKKTLIILGIIMRKNVSTLLITLKNKLTLYFYFKNQKLRTLFRMKSWFSTLFDKFETATHSPTSFGVSPYLSMAFLSAPNCINIPLIFTSWFCFPLLGLDKMSQRWYYKNWSVIKTNITL